MVLVAALLLRDKMAFRMLLRPATQLARASATVARVTSVHSRNASTVLSAAARSTLAVRSSVAPAALTVGQARTMAIISEYNELTEARNAEGGVAPPLHAAQVATLVEELKVGRPALPEALLRAGAAGCTRCSGARRARSPGFAGLPLSGSRECVLCALLCRGSLPLPAFPAR